MFVIQSGNLGPETIYFSTADDLRHTVSVHENIQPGNPQRLRERRTNAKVTLYYNRNQQMGFYYSDATKENPNNEEE